MSERRDTRFAIVATALWVVVIAIGLWQHELFRDEWQGWLLARDSNSITDLLHNMRYEGHPPGWHLVLWGASRFTRSIVAMQVIQLVVTGMAMWVLFRYAPFPRWVRLLFAFGYFPLYEYSIITRSYGLGMLLLFAACAGWRYRRTKPWPMAIALALLVQTSAYGVLLAFALCAAVLAEWALDAEARKAIRPATGLAVLLVLASTAASIVTMRPPADASFDGRPLPEQLESSTPRAVRALALVPPRVVLPIPRFEDGVPVWGETAAVSGGGIPNAPIIGIAVLLLLAAWVAPRPAALTALAAGGGAMMAFMFLVHFGKFRHHGHLLLLAWACAWLSCEPGPELGDGAARRFVARIRKVAGPALVGVLIVQVAAATILYTADFRYRFTPAPDVARAIAARGGDRLPVAGTQAAYASSIAGALDRPVYYVDGALWGTFILWNRVPDAPSPDRTLSGMEPLLADGDTALLVTSFPLPGLQAGTIRAEPIPLPAGPIVGTERMWAWEVVRTR